MEFILIFLMQSIVTLGQTAHVEKGKVVYKGSLDIAGQSKEDMHKHAKQIIWDYVNKEKDSLKENEEKNEWVSIGEIRLHSSYKLVKTLCYRLTLKSKDSDLNYVIDSVYLKLHERGAKTKLIPSEELLKGMETSGQESMESEKLLNEIDMQIQKLLDLMNAGIRKEKISKVSKK